MFELLYRTDNLIYLTGAKALANDAYINTATVTLTVYFGETNTVVPGQSWPTPMLYAGGGTGKYQANISEDIEVEPLTFIDAHIIFDAGPGLHREWRIPMLVVEDRTP